MQKFFFRARAQDGVLVRESIDAIDLSEAKKRLMEMGLIPLEITDKESFLSRLRKSWIRITPEDFLAFNRQFQIVYGVGMPLLRGLELVERQTMNPRLKEALMQIRTDLGNGRTLNEAFAKHPNIFDSTYVSLLRVGEASGKLDAVLERISKFSQERVENRERVKSATLYPKIVAGTLALVFTIVVYFVIPKIKTFFDQFGADLPGVTILLMQISNAFVSYWYILLALGFGAYTAFKKIVATPTGRAHWDNFKLHTPVFGNLVTLIETKSFASTLELLITGGVPILDGLRLTRDALSNTVFRSDVEKCINNVDNGGTLSQVLEKSKTFPPLVSGLIAVGEETGEMDKVLGQIGSYYQMQINHRLDNLSKTLEPILLFIVFGAVLVLALGVYLPLWKMSAIIKR